MFLFLNLSDQKKKYVYFGKKRPESNFYKASDEIQNNISYYWLNFLLII